MFKRKKRLQDRRRYRSQYGCEAIFGLLCPVKNDDWLPGWRQQREMIYSNSGSAEAGCVFRVTNQPHLMGAAILVNNVYQPFQKIQYSAVNEVLVYQIQWDLTPLENGTDVEISRVWTALTAGAEEFLGQLENPEEQHLPTLFEFAEYYLTYGKMMNP